MNRRGFHLAALAGSAAIGLGLAASARPTRAATLLEQALAASVCRGAGARTRPVAARLPLQLSFAGTRLFKEGFLDELVEAYTRRTGRPVHVLGGGCDDGISAVRRFESHVGGLCCPLGGSAAEGLDHLLVGYDIKAVLAHPSLPIDQIRWRDLQLLVTGRITNWNQLGGPDQPIALVVNDHCPDYAEPVREMMLNSQGGWSINALFAKTDQKHLETLMRFDSAIGINSWILGAPLVAAGRLKRLAVDGVMPTVEAVQSRRYRLVGPMNMIFQQWHPELMDPFFAFLYSDVGRRIAARHLVPVSAREAGFPRVARYTPA